MDEPRASPRSVIIVGAGWSGLSAAHHLCSSGAPVSVQVLEASGRVGGRCHSATLPVSGPVEMGATWFHGTENNPVFDFAVAQGIIDAGAGTMSDDAASDDAVADAPSDAAPGSSTADGAAAAAAAAQQQPAQAAPGTPGFRLELCRMHERQPLSGEAMAAAVTAMGEFAEVLEELHSESTGTIGQALRAYVDQEVAAGKGPGGKDPVATRTYMEAWATRERLQRAYDGFASSDMSSVTFAQEYHDLEGPNIPVPGGYQALAERLAATLPPGTVRFNTSVKLVDYSQSTGAGVCVVVDTEGGERELRADAVVVTVSLGVLKHQAAELFTPPLPSAKLDAIARMHIGFVNKVFVEWPLAGGATAERSAPAASAGAAGQLPPCARGGADAAAAVGPRKKRVDGGSSQPASALQQLGITADDAAALRIANGGALGAFAATPRAPPLMVYCLMWPTSAAAWGAAGAPAGSWPAGEEHPIAGPLDEWVAAMLPRRDAVYESAAAADGLPLWLRGLHSWRYGDGPEWIHAPAATAGGGGGAVPPPEQRRRAAVLWVTGASALAVERLEEATLAQHLRQLLASFPAVPLPEGASQSDPIRVYTSRWGSDARTRGSYSYYGPGSDASTVAALAEPLTAPGGGGEAVPLVCFAGEATHRNHMGTVHGAWQTGEREAARLLAAWAAATPTQGA